MKPNDDLQEALPGPFTDPVGGLADKAWDEIAGDRFYSTALWLRLCALESGGLSGGVHIDLPGGARAAVPVSAVTNQQNIRLRWHDILASKGLPAPPPEGVLIGQTRGYLAHLLGTPGTDRTVVASELLGAVRAVQSPIGATQAHVAMYLTTPDVRALREAGVRTMPVVLAADAWIEMPDGDWDAWLHSLRKRSRESVRRELRLFERAGYRLEHTVLTDCYRDVARLTGQTQSRYGHAVDPAMFVEAFRRHAEVAGPHALVTLLHAPDEAEAVGCFLYMRHGDVVYARGVGFDYARLKDAGEYFNLAYYVSLRLPGVRAVHAGMQSADAKSRRGARLTPLWLLDLSEDSVLIGHEAEIAEHNRAYLRELQHLSPSVADSLDLDLWNEFV